METLNNVIRRIAAACGIAGEVTVCLLMLLVTAEIVARHVFGSPIPGQVEMAVLSLTVIVYLGLAHAQSQRDHIRVEVFICRFEGRKREAFEALALLICLVPTIFMLCATTKQAYISVRGHEFVTGIISFPVWPSRCIVSLGLALLAFVLVVQICNHLLGLLGLRKKGMEK